MYLADGAMIIYAKSIQKPARRVKTPDWQTKKYDYYRTANHSLKRCRICRLICRGGVGGEVMVLCALLWVVFTSGFEPLVVILLLLGLTAREVQRVCFVPLLHG